MSDNIFDEDDALDYIIYDELENQEEQEDQTESRGGCLTLLAFLLVPGCGLLFLTRLI